MLVLLGVSLLALAASAIAYVLSNGHRPAPANEKPPAAETVIPPTQLPGLGYLPADDNIVLALQTTPILAYAARQASEPRDLLKRAGIPAEVLNNLDAMGLQLPQIDHVVLGFSLDSAEATIRMTLVLVLKQPLADEAAFLHGLKAQAVLGKNRYQVDLGGIPFTLAPATPEIWVFGFQDKDFSAVDRGGFGPGGRQLPPSLGRTIAEKLPLDAAIWAATGEENWVANQTLKLLLKFAQARGTIKKEWIEALAKLRAISASMSFDNPPRLRLAVTMADSTSAEAARGYFQKLISGTDVGSYGGGGDRVSFDTPIDPAQLATTVKRYLDAAK